MTNSREPALVRITDPLAIRALAHPARMTVIDALYARRTSMTSTQLATMTGLSPSAMSYHLRSLERFGLVRRATTPGDGREQPWIRAARSLTVTPKAGDVSRATRAATGALIATAMERDQIGILAAQERKARGDSSVPLDAATGFSRRTLIVTVKEAQKLSRAFNELLEPFLEEHRSVVPAGAGRINWSSAVVPDDTYTSWPPKT